MAYHGSLLPIAIFQRLPVAVAIVIAIATAIVASDVAGLLIHPLPFGQLAVRVVRVHVLTAIAHGALSALLRLEPRGTHRQICTAHDRNEEIEESTSVRVGIDTRDRELHKASAACRLQGRGWK